MYETFYGLGGNAFRVTPDYRCMFPHNSYAAAAETLLEAAERGEGFALLTGAPGIGKTTLIEDLAARLENDGYCVGKVANSQVDADELLQLIGFAFGLHSNAFSKVGLLTHLKDQFISKGRHGRPAILIIDDAQDLTAAALEELRLLCNLTAKYGPVVHILLAGQKRLWERLSQPECEQIQQLVVASCRLDPLSPSETRTYIAHALQLVGWNGDPEISADALRLLHEHTGGVPRLINLTMGRLLLHGSLNEAHALDTEDVESVLAQLGKDHPDLLLDTSEQLPPPQPAPGQPILPLDVRSANEPEQHEKPRWQERFSLSTLARTRDTATQTLKDGLQRVAGWNWKWALAGLSAAAIFAAIILFFVNFADDQPAESAARESLGEEESGVPTRVRFGLSTAREQIETPLDQAPSPVPMTANTEIVDPAGESGGTEGPEPDPVAGESAIVSTDPMAEELLDSPAGTLATHVVALDKEYKVGITAEWPSIAVMHDGENIEVKRIQDMDNRLLDDFSKTSRPCPPFCIHPISAAPGVTTVGEVELLRFIKGSVESETGLLIDARMPKWHKAETIPGSINIPFIVFTSSREIVKTLLLELGVTEEQGELNYDNALSLLLYCNGPWCDQSPRAIKALLELGYPPEKLYYYRGGMQSWKLLGLTTAIPRFH